MARLFFNLLSMIGKVLMCLHQTGKPEDSLSTVDRIADLCYLVHLFSGSESLNLFSTVLLCD